MNIKQFPYSYYGTKTAENQSAVSVFLAVGKTVL